MTGEFSPGGHTCRLGSKGEETKKGGAVRRPLLHLMMSLFSGLEKVVEKLVRLLQLRIQSLEFLG